MPEGTHVLWKGGLCFFLKTSESAANDRSQAGAVINLILSGLHPTPRAAGGWGGKKKEERKAEGWAAGPHPARPGAEA